MFENFAELLSCTINRGANPIKNDIVFICILTLGLRRKNSEFDNFSVQKITPCELD